MSKFNIINQIASIIVYEKIIASLQNKQNIQSANISIANTPLMYEAPPIPFYWQWDIGSFVLWGNNTKIRIN